jgi:cytochrome c553
MFKNLISTFSGAVVIFAVVAVPANAADEIDAAKVQVCSSCHGQNGEPTNPVTTPIIWGQQSSYLFKQLHDYRSGDRENAIMSAMAKSVAQEDMRKVAAYFAAKPWPPKKAAATPVAAPSEEKIGVCKACHQPNFEGGPPAPRLAGLSYEYLLGAMNGFADGQRTNNLDMPTLMKALTPAERDAIAHYLAAL